jgi:hypothetical protein
MPIDQTASMSSCSTATGAIEEGQFAPGQSPYPFCVYGGPQ